MQVKFDGVNEMKAKLRQLQLTMPQQIARAIYIEANIEMTEAKARTPVDVNYAGGRKPPHPGQLRASGRVSDPAFDGKNIGVILSFGGAAVDYAVYVHEIIENFHPVGQAKFLESVLNESRPYMAERIGKRIQF